MLGDVLSGLNPPSVLPCFLSESLCIIHEATLEIQLVSSESVEFLIKESGRLSHFNIENFKQLISHPEINKISPNQLKVYDFDKLDLNEISFNSDIHASAKYRASLIKNMLPKLINNMF